MALKGAEEAPLLLHLTPAPLLKERGYKSHYQSLTPLLLKEKGLGDEANKKADG
jgi:hypothetical protein